MDRLLLLLPTTTYRTEDFVEAATGLGVDLICASEAPSTFEALAPDHLLTLDFADPEAAATAVAEAPEPLASVIVTCGFVYPLPGLRSVSAVMTPPTTVADAVAPVPVPP